MPPPPDPNDLVTKYIGTATKVARYHTRRRVPLVTFEEALAACLVGIWRAADRITAADDPDAYAYGVANLSARRFVLDMRRFARCGGISRLPRSADSLVFTDGADDGPHLADRVPDRAECEVGLSWSVERWRELLACLPPDMRRVVTARLLRDLSFDEIAAEIGGTPEHASDLWCKALVAIRAAHPELAEATAA